MAQYFSRMGDGSPISMTKDEIMADLIQGSEDAADRAKVPPLSQEEYFTYTSFTTSTKEARKKWIKT